MPGATGSGYRYAGAIDGEDVGRWGHGLEGAVIDLGHFFSGLRRRGGKALHLLWNPTFRSGLRKGVGAAIEHRPLVSVLDIATLVDVGANVGQFSLLVRATHPKARIYAFEPLPEAARKFRAVLPPQASVTLFTSAIGPYAGNAEMHIARKSDSSSLLPMTERLSRIFPGTEKIGSVAVPVSPLNGLLTAAEIVDPALLKIDVQGGELDVLRGCESLLGRFKYIYVELSFVELYVGQPLCRDVIRHLAARGFELAVVNNLVRDRGGLPIQADFLFVCADARSSDLVSWRRPVS